MKRFLVSFYCSSLLIILLNTASSLVNLNDKFLIPNKTELMILIIVFIKLFAYFWKRYKED
jgi:hypothetical protein